MRIECSAVVLLETAYLHLAYFNRQALHCSLQPLQNEITGNSLGLFIGKTQLIGKFA